MSTVEPDVPDEMAAHHFAEPWQAEAFALALALNQKQAFDWREWVDVFSTQPGALLAGEATAIEAAYYRRWLSALETITAAHGLVSTPEVDSRVEEWRRAYLRTPHGQPIELACGLAPLTADEARHDHDDGDHEHHHNAIRPLPVSVSPAIPKS